MNLHIFVLKPDLPKIDFYKSRLFENDEAAE